MKKLLTILFIIPLLSIAQDKGITFEHNSTWEKVKAKAKATNKYIFVDCFTTWCGPCKYMTANIFPQEKVGDFFNANFVNLKLQMDETKADSEEVKSWAAEAKRFATDYKVIAYPTFLIFNTDGELVHRIVGGSQADQFIAMAKAGLNPDTQSELVIKQYKANPNDAAIAKKAAQVGKTTYDSKLSEEATARYISLVGLENLLTSDDVELLLSTVNSSSSPSYNIVKSNMAKVDELLKEKKIDKNANDVLATVLAKELISPELRYKGKIVDFSSLKQRIEQDHPYVDMGNAVRDIKTRYYLSERNWPAFRDAVNEYIADSPQPVSPYTLNNFAWAIFENCDDPACLQSALAWSKRSVEGDEDPMYIDTYANLLYKAGDKENAIKWLEKAIEKAKEAEKEGYMATLDKMKKGDPTWN